MFIKKIKNLRLFERRLLLKSLKSRLFITGLLILSLYAAIAFGVYRFFLLNLVSQIKTEMVLGLRAVTLSHDLPEVINATIRKNIDIIFILGSFIIFGITLIFIIIVAIKNEVIKESEAKYFRIFKSNSAPIVMLDVNTVDIEDVNYSAVNFVL